MSKQPMKPIIIKKESLQKLVFVNNSFVSTTPNFLFINQPTKTEPVKVEPVQTVPIKTEQENSESADTEPMIITEKSDTGSKKYVILKTAPKSQPEEPKINVLKPQGNLNFFTTNRDGRKVIYIQKVDASPQATPKRKEIRNFRVTSAAAKPKKEKPPPPPPSPPPPPFVYTPKPRTPVVVTLDDVRGKNQIQNVYIPIKKSEDITPVQNVRIPVKQASPARKRAAPEDRQKPSVGRPKVLVVQQDLSVVKQELPVVKQDSSAVKPNALVKQNSSDCARVKMKFASPKAATFQETYEMNVEQFVKVKEEVKFEEVNQEPEQYFEEIMEEAGCEVTVSTEDEPATKVEYTEDVTYQEETMEEAEGEAITAYECSECHMQFDNEEDITAHLEEGHTFSYECTQCNHQTLDPEEARSHFRDAHQMELVLAEEEEEDQLTDKPQEAEEWQASEDFVASVVLLNQDQGAQEEERADEEGNSDDALECHFCFQTFYSQDALDQHVRKHEADRNITVDNLNKDNPFCQECNQSFESNQEWTKHILNSRKHKDMKRIILNGCRHCGETFRSPNDFREHVKQAHPEKAIKRSWTEPQPCNICGELIPDAHKYWGHYKKEHPNEEYPRSKPCKYKCDECSAQFRCRSLLKLHMNKHLGLRLFACTECPKTFYTALSLKYHQIAHSEVRPFDCPVCGRAFKFKAAMERHQLVHTGERPYVCGVCGQGYTTMHWTQLHVRKVHNNEHIPYKPRIRKRRNKPKKSASSDEENLLVSGTMDN